MFETREKLQGLILAEVKKSGRLLRLAGDGRCDSPGYNAKFLSYSLLDMETDAIVTFVVVAVNITGSSSRIEVEGFRRSMLQLCEKGFAVEVLATDRHVQIRSIMKKEFHHVDHQFDIWHLAKSVKKELTAKAKLKGTEDLNLWIRSISNHLWWAAANCKGDQDWLEECWVSIVNHVASIHSFKGEKMTQCAHSPLTSEQSRMKKWLKVGSRAHNASTEVALDKRLRKDIRQLSVLSHRKSRGLSFYDDKICPQASVLPARSNGSSHGTGCN